MRYFLNRLPECCFSVPDKGGDTGNSFVTAFNHLLKMRDDFSDTTAGGGVQEA
jgi:hypothetical protein